MKKKESIGHWAAKNGATITKIANWRMVRGRGETFALINLKALVLRNSAIIAELDLGPVARGSSRPVSATWEPGSAEVAEAADLKVRAEAISVDNIPATCFRGYDYVMPWELAEPPKPSIWRRFIAWITFRKGGVA